MHERVEVAGQSAWRAELSGLCVGRPSANVPLCTQQGKSQAALGVELVALVTPGALSSPVCA